MRARSEKATAPRRPAVRFALRHGMRHEEMVRLRQQVRYLALSELLRPDRSDDGDLTPYELSVFSQANSVFLADARWWSGTFVEASEDEYRELRTKYASSEPSRGAVVKLGRKLGYRLVHLDLSVINAFFVDKDLVEGHFPNKAEVLGRVPNFFLYGDRHPVCTSGRSYVKPELAGDRPALQ